MLQAQAVSGGTYQRKGLFCQRLPCHQEEPDGTAPNLGPAGHIEGEVFLVVSPMLMADVYVLTIVFDGSRYRQYRCSSRYDLGYVIICESVLKHAICANPTLFQYLL